MSETLNFNMRVTATELGNKAGETLTAAERGPVGVTKHGKTKYVILSIDRYEALKESGDTRRSYTLETLPDDVMSAVIDANADLLEERE